MFGNISHKLVLFVFLICSILLTQGCAERSIMCHIQDWQAYSKAENIGTPQAYKNFLKNRPPGSLFDARARERAIALGFTTISLNPALASDLSLSRKTRGLLILQLLKGGGVDKAGLQSGDVILKIDAKSVKEIKDVHLILGSHKRGDKVTLTVWRDKQKRDRTVTVRGITEEPFITKLPTPPSRRAKTIVVAQDGSGDFRTLLIAAIKARREDVIRVRSGKYPGLPLSRDGIRYEAESQKVKVAYFDLKSAKDIEIRGFTIDREDSSYYCLYLRNATNIQIENCVIRNGRGGILIENSDGVTINECKITANNIRGIWVGDSKVKIEKNLIFKNNIPLQGFLPSGIVLNHSLAEVKNNTIVENGNGGIWLRNNSNVSIYNNIIIGHTWGIVVQEKNTCRIEYNCLFNNNTQANVEYSETNVSIDPIFVSILDEDYHLDLGSPILYKGKGGSYIGALPPVGYKVGEGEFK